MFFLGPCRSLQSTCTRSKIKSFIHFHVSYPLASLDILIFVWVNRSIGSTIYYILIIHRSFLFCRLLPFFFSFPPPPPPVNNFYTNLYISYTYGLFFPLFCWEIPSGRYPKRREQPHSALLGSWSIKNANNFIECYIRFSFSWIRIETKVFLRILSLEYFIKLRH